MFEKREAEYDIKSESAPIGNRSRSSARIARNGRLVCAASWRCSPLYCSRSHVRTERCLRLQSREPADNQQLVRNTPQLGRLPRSPRKHPIVKPPAAEIME